jgi:hypothetical protein
VCDGIDDQIDVQKAVDKANPGDIIFFYNGEYILNPTKSGSSMHKNYADWRVAVTVNKSLEITGESNAIITFKDGVKVPIGMGIIAFALVNDSNGNPIQNFKIDNLKFDGNKKKTTTTFSNFVFIRSANNVWITNNNISDANYPIWGDGMMASYYTHIINNTINCSRWNGIALHNLGSYGEIKNNTIYNPMIGIMLDTTNYVTVSNNKIYNTANFNGVAIKLFDKANNCIITNNLIDGAYNNPWAIYMYTIITPIHNTCNNNIIKNNIIKNFSQGNGIEIYGKGNKIQNNELTQIGGIFIQNDGMNSIITNNTSPPSISATPNGGYYNKTKQVILKINNAGTIYYTENGTLPTIFSTIYNNPIIISTTTTLKFFAIDLSGNKSPIYTDVYTIDKVSPKVMSSSPANNASGVSLTVPITIKFSKNIIAGANYSKIYIKNINTGIIVSITKSISGNTLTIKMTKNRLHNDTYNVIIPSGAVKDMAGNNLLITNTITFKTA